MVCRVKECSCKIGGLKDFAKEACKMCGETWKEDAELDLANQKSWKLCRMTKTTSQMDCFVCTVANHVHNYGVAVLVMTEVRTHQNSRLI